MIGLWSAWLLGGATTAMADAPDPSRILERLVADAMDASPTVAASVHRQRALQDRADVAGAWPDPVLSVEYSNAPIDRWTLTEHPMSGVQLRVQQPLRTPGWSSLRRAARTTQADQGIHATEELALHVRHSVHDTWWRLARNQMLRTRTEHHLQATTELLSAVRSRYETGGVGQSAVLRLEVLRDRLTDGLGDFDQASTALQATLHELVGRDVSTDTPSEVTPLSPPGDADWSVVANTHRPMLAELRLAAHGADQRAQLARVDALPEPTVWAAYRIRSAAVPGDAGTDFVSLGIGVPVPLGSGRQARGEQSAALHEVQAARSTHQAALDRIVTEVRSRLAAWRRAHDKTLAYDDTLLPAARSALTTTQADFSVGRVDFGALFDAEVALIELERDRIVAAVETHLQHAAVTAALGVDPGDTP